MIWHAAIHILFITPVNSTESQLIIYVHSASLFPHEREELRKLKKPTKSRGEGPSAEPLVVSQI